jgi:group I intron endonuclease
MIIYKATNQLNKKCYIGQTIRSLKERKKQHIIDSKRQKYSHYIFYRALNKYGINNFKWEIIDENIKDHDTLNVLEELEIIIHDSYNNGYNMTTGGCGSSGKFHSKETRKKMSKSRKGQIPWHMGKNLSKEHKESIRKSLINNKLISSPVYQKNKDTNEIINEYPSIQEASRKTNICNPNIHKCIHGKRKTAGGFKWEAK